MKNRRNFIKKLVAGMAFTGLLPYSKKTMASEIKIKGALVHHVFFWLNEPNNQQQRKQFEAGIKKLLTVKTIRMSHFGQPASTEKRDVVDNSFTYSYMVMFDSVEDQNSYQTDPIHLKFVEENSHLWKKVVVYDSVD